MNYERCLKKQTKFQWSGWNRRTLESGIIVKHISCELSETAVGKEVVVRLNARREGSRFVGLDTSTTRADFQKEEQSGESVATVI